jgi:hypothetical protein
MAGGKNDHRWFDFTAFSQGLSAALVKTAARRRIEQVWRVTGDRRGQVSLPFDIGKGGNQRPGLGVGRAVKNIFGRSAFNYFPGIHYRNPVTGFANNGKIVGYQDHSHLPFPAQAFE